MSDSVAPPLTPADLLAGLRPEATGAPTSAIVEIFKAGRGREGLIPLWVGEGDLPTPAFICEAATRSLAAGETFYTYQRGLPELRAALATYHAGLYHRAFDPERFFVTIGGMQAMQIAARMIAGSGDEILLPTPAWINFQASLELTGASAVTVPMRMEHGRWRIHAEDLARAATARTRAIVINSPGNPTGWSATREELQAILDLARRHGWWIIADETYNRFVFDGSNCAPSFHDIAGDDERILYVQTFSKNWAMTGWRIGWLEAPVALGQVVENLIQYGSSGVASFIQRGAIAAVERGEGFIAHQVARARANRDLLVQRLGGDGRFSFGAADGAFYLFFDIAGETNANKLALRLIEEAGVGLAPGSAFGPGCERYLRLCFARNSEQIAEAADRLVRWVEHRDAGKR